MPTLKKKLHISNIVTSTKKFNNISNKYYNTTNWRTLRQHILNEQIFCQDCLKQSRYVQATDVHHIIPFMSGLTTLEQYILFNDPNNLVALCDSCHHKRHSKKYKQNSHKEYR